MAQDKNYCAYHVHTELSLLDSTTNYKKYINKAVELGQKAICFTEHGNIFNWVEKKMYCKENGIKYLHGCEVYLTESHEEKVRDNYHTVLIAKNYEGIKELNGLIDLSTDEKHTYYKPRISFDEFLAISNNVIKISACLQSPLNKIENRIKNLKEKLQDTSEDNPDLIENKIIGLRNYYEQLIGAYDYYEIQPHVNSDEQKEYNLKLLRLSKATGIPLIAGTDTHSIDAYKAECRTILQYSKSIIFDNEDEFDLTYKSYDELVDMFHKQGCIKESVYLEAIENTNVMADSVEDFELDLSFKYPKMDGDEDELFKKRVNEMYQDKVSKGIISSDPIYLENINEEYRVLKKIGMLSFMYFMSELCCWCHENNIPTGFCRGSVGGSYIAYILDIIDLDPLVWGTKFSRFANEDRVEIGDIDIDFAPKDREKVYNHIISQSGEGKTAFILTTNTLADKGTIDDIVRAFANKYRVDNGLPDKAETPYSLSYAKEIKDAFEYNPTEARELYKDIFYYFDGMRGCVVSKGIHPAGIVVSPVTLPDNYGTFWYDGKRVTMINMEEIHEVSLVKYDILGLKNIGIIKDACEMIGMNYPRSHEVDWQNDRVWDDMPTSNVGIFQFESNYAGDLLKRFKPTKVNDLSLINASLRPSGESYRNRLIEREKNHNPSEIIDELLKDNNGYLVFQEDVTKFLQDICGLSGSRADNVRRAIGRKQMDRLQEALPEILEGYCAKSSKPRAVAEEEAKVFLKIIEDASSYMFGYNHSTGYSMIGYVCAYLRYFHPAEFVAAYLNNADNDDDISQGTELATIKDVKINRIKFRYSRWEYFVDGSSGNVYKGLSSIKYMNKQVADDLFSIRDKHFDTFLDLLLEMTRLTINSRQLDILIKINFFEEFGDINDLLYAADVFDRFYKKNQIKKDKLKECGIPDEIVRGYCEKETDTRVEEIDCVGFVKSLGFNEDDLDDCIKYKNVKDGDGIIKVPDGYSSKKVMKKYIASDEQKQAFATKIVIGRFSGIDYMGLIRYLVSNHNEEKCKTVDLIKYQSELQGYVDYINEDLDWRYVAVTNLNTKYSPKFVAYSLNNGKSVEMKVSKKLNKRDKKVKTAYDTHPFEDGDVIYINKVVKQPKKMKTENGFEDVPGVYEWWIKDYRKVKEDIC